MAFKIEEKGNITDLFLKNEEKIEEVTKKVAMDLFTSVILKTPVDTGRARGNWICSVDRPSQHTRKSTDKSGGKTLDKVASKIDESELGQKIYLSNNLPYIGKLEYGGYGDKNSTSKTTKGFSSQAPEGMVRISLQEIEGKFKEIVDDD